MSGVAAPVYIIVEPFGQGAASPTDITLPIPVDSQIGVQPAAASFTDGFPPATRTDPEAGGQAPFGQDMNGILYMLSAYCAMLQAGQRVSFSVPAAAAFGGYAIGAEVASTITAGLVWVNLVDGNSNDPDANPVGWYSRTPIYASVAPTAGTKNDYVLPGASDFALDVDTTAGNIDITGFVAQRNGQRITLSNTGPNLLQILPQDAGSAAANRVRFPTAGGPLAIITDQSTTIQYFAPLNRWLIV